MSNIFPALKYRDSNRALEWLQEAFGFEPGVAFRDEGGDIVHAVMWYGEGGMMLGKASLPEKASADGHAIYVTVEDPDAHCERAREAGAEVLYGPESTSYGSREYGAKDFEGNNWSFGTYAPERKRTTTREE